jgi:TIR domain
LKQSALLVKLYFDRKTPRSDLISMLEIKFDIGGAGPGSHGLQDSLEQMMFEAVENELRSKLSGIRDPETGEFPVVVVRGRDFDNMSIDVEGSEQLIRLIQRVLKDSEVGTDQQYDQQGVTMNETDKSPSPKAFLCHASEDKDLARKIANDFQSNGIDTFFDEWEIGPGDSLRRKIERGLADCTHFIALLTSTSIAKPWVNEEMDAALVQAVEGKCKFIPLRSNLEIEALSPLLRSRHSPELSSYQDDMDSLVSFIHGISNKPPLGSPPMVIQESKGSKTGLSPAAELIANLLIKETVTGCPNDPQFTASEIRQRTEMADDDIIDAADELEGRGLIQLHKNPNMDKIGFERIVPEATLFSSMDQFFMNWIPAEDALRLAAELENGVESGNTEKMAESLGWPPRRFNPAVHYLIERDLVKHRRPMGSHPWYCTSITKTAKTRRFVLDRS